MEEMFKEKYMIEYWIMFILLIVVTISFFKLINDTNKYCDECKYCESMFYSFENNERYKMYNESLKYNTKINGVYHTSDYYCVWTRGRNTTEINKTDYHEMCHHLVYMNRKHFCEDY